MPVLKIKEDGTWKKVSNVNMLSLGESKRMSFESTASGVIPDYQHGIAESILNLSDGIFEGSVVGELTE